MGGDQSILATSILQLKDPNSFPQVWPTVYFDGQGSRVIWKGPVFLAPKTNRYFNADRAWNFAFNCSGYNYPIGETFALCVDDAHFQGLPWDIRRDAQQTSDVMLYSAEQVFKNIERDCGKGTFDLVWPFFYQRYGDPEGKKAIDEFLLSNNGANVKCGELLKNVEFDASIQRNYQFMNQTSQCLRDNFLIPYTGDVNSWGGATPSLNVESCLDPKETFSDTMAHLDWQPALDGGFHLAHDPTRRDNPQKLTDPGFVGSPYWLYDERVHFQKIAFGFVPHGPRGPDQRAPINAPGYTGEFPYLHFASNQYNPVKNPKITKKKGGAGEGYRDPCLQEDFVEKYVPIIGAIVLTALPATLFPEETLGRTLILASIGASSFFALRGGLGMEPPKNPLQPFNPGGHDQTYNIYAASIATIGLPAGFVALGFERNLFADIGISADFQIPVMSLAALGSLYFVEPKLESVLDLTSGVSTTILAPLLSFIKGIKELFNGCFISHRFKTDADCLCSEADAVSGGKSDIIDDWMDVYYQTTKDQRKMRVQCLNAEMQRGAWAATGADRNIISQCGGTTTNYMDNPMACYSAGAWTFGPPSMPDFKRPPLAELMWNQIYHCLDPDNVSALPPITAPDVECQKKYGEHFRWDTPTKRCLNYLLPGPAYDSDGNVILPSLQGPGEAPPDDPGNKGCPIQ